MSNDETSLQAMEPLIGAWAIFATFGDVPSADIGARVTFEWLAGNQFLVQRWAVPVPEAPDGIPLIGADFESDGAFLQHYFDSRGVARVYRMQFCDGFWTMERNTPDFSPLDFCQRFTARLSEDGRTISGTWEISHDGTTWERDFDLTCEKVDRTCSSRLRLAWEACRGGAHDRSRCGRTGVARRALRRDGRVGDNARRDRHRELTGAQPPAVCGGASWSDGAPGAGTGDHRRPTLRTLEAPCIVRGTVGDGDRLIYFHGHFDVVPVQDRRQFDVERRDGNLRGRDTAA